jgi:hypothetical protein
MLLQVAPNAQDLVVPMAHRADTLLLMAERHTRATAAMQEWAREAKRCFDYVEGRQWTREQLAALEREDRPAQKFNKLARLVRLVLGYHRNNRTDLRFLPAATGVGSEEVADRLTQLAKVVSEMNQKEYVDGEVFLDGIVGGRGFYDCRLNFEKNELGEARWRAKDPFSIKIDPDADSYDPEEWCYVMDDRWLSIDETAFLYGSHVATILRPLLGGVGYRGGIPASISDLEDTIAPWRSFGGRSDEYGNQYLAIDAYFANVIDPYRKSVRMVECQHYVRVQQTCFVNLETGDKEPVPTATPYDKIQKVLAYYQELYARHGKASPWRVMRRPVRRVRWTTVVGDIVVHDDWSRYESFTIIPYFPYFRRGVTRGMAADLLDPQDEIIKRRSSQTDIVTRTAHSGWIYHENGVDPDQAEKLERYGAMPGINIKWKGESHMKPTKIEPGIPPTAMERLEQKAADDMLEIAGINESALGFLDRVQSGRAIEARQRQAVLSIQLYMDNDLRTQWLCGRKLIEMFQNHYTEERLYRMRTDLGRPAQMLLLNLRDDFTGQVLYDVTLGKYVAVIDQTPLSASYVQGQFEELTMLVQSGILPIPLIQDVAVELSTLPKKDLIKARIAAAQAIGGIPLPGGAFLPPGFQMGVPPAGMGGSPGLLGRGEGGMVAGGDVRSQEPAGAAPPPAPPGLA